MVNPNIVSDGVNTRFGHPGGAHPSAAAKKGLPKRSIRKELKYLAAQPASDDVMKDLRRGVQRPTFAQIIAASLLQRAMDGDTKACILVTNAIDGKVPTYNPNVDFRRIEKMTDKELDDLIKECSKKIAAFPTV